MSSSRWQTPKSNRIQSKHHLVQPPSTSNLSSLKFLRSLITHNLEHAISPLTRQKYTCAWQNFYHFCSTFSLKFTPDVKTLSFYISISSQSISPRSVEVYLSGIAYMFKSKFPEIPCQTHHPHFRQILKGCKKQFSKPIKRKDPLDLNLLKMAVSSLGRSYDEILFLSILSVGFASLH